MGCAPFEKRMKFPLGIVDAFYKIRGKYNKPEFFIGYRLAPEESFEDSISKTKTLPLVKELIKIPLQFIYFSQRNYFKKN